MKRRSILYSAVLLLALPIASTSAFAQLESGTVNDTVTDRSGAVVSGARVPIADLGTNISQTASTGEHGSFHFATLKPSHYRLSVVANGFNHPLFGDPGTNDTRNVLTDQNFGVSSHTLADSLGGDGADGGFSSLCHIGSPRSLQFALNLQF